MKKIIIKSILVLFVFYTSLFAYDCTNQYNQAVEYFKNGKIYSALQIYKDIVVNCNDIVLKHKAQFEISRCYYYKKDYSKSVDNLNNLINAVTNKNMKMKAMIYKGDVYYLSKQYQNAVTSYQGVIDQYPAENLFSTKLQKVKCYIKLNNKTQAENLLLDMKEEYKHINYYVKQIQYYLNRLNN